MAQELIPQQTTQQPPIRLVGGPQTGVAEDFRIDNTQGEFLKGWNAPLAAEAAAEAAAEVNAARQRGDHAAADEHLRRMQELQAAAQANAPRVSSIGGINNFTDAMDYGKQLAGGIIPGAIKPVLGGTAGGILGAALGARFKLGAGTRALFGTGGALGAMFPGMRDTAVQQHIVANDQQSPDAIATQSNVQALKQLAPFAFGGGAVQQFGNRVVGNVAQGVRQAGIGTSLAKSAIEQGALGTASTAIGQQEQNRWNPNRDKSGDNMELVDSFASNALQAVPFEAPGYAAQAFHQTRRDAQSAIGALAQEGVRVAPGLIDQGVAKVKNSLGIAGEAINNGVDQAAAAADNALANAPKSVAEAAGLASGRSRNALDELLRDKSGDFAQQPAFADLFTPLKGDVDAKNILAQTAAKNKAAEAFANYTLGMGDNAPPYVRAAAEEYLAGPKNYDTWHTSGLADAANVWEQSRKRNDQMASIYTSLGVAGAKALAEFQNGRDEARSEGPLTSTPKGIEKRYNDIFNSLTGVSDPAQQHVEAKWLLDVEQAVGRYKNDKPIAGDDEKIAWYRTHPNVFNELPKNKALEGMVKTLYDNHGPLPYSEQLGALNSYGDLQRSVSKRAHLRKLQNPSGLQLSLGDNFVPRDNRLTPPNPFEETAPRGLRNDAVPAEAALSQRLFNLDQHNQDVFKQAYLRTEGNANARSILLQKFGLKAPPVKGELPNNQILDSYTDRTGREVRHQTNLGVNRAPMSEKDWVAISNGQLQKTGARSESVRTVQTNQSAATEAYNQNLYAKQRNTFGSPGEKARARQIESDIGRTEAGNQRDYQQQKAVVENLRDSIRNNPEFDASRVEVELRKNPELLEAEYKLEDIGKKLAVKEVKPLSDARFTELMGKFPEINEAETAELTAHAPYLIDSLRLKKKLSKSDEGNLKIANELITHAAREKQRFDSVKPQATDGVKYKRQEQAWAGISDATKDDPFNKALTTALAPHYPHQHIGAQQHDLPMHALGLRLWIGNGLDTRAPRKGDNGKLYVNPKGEMTGLDIMASVWGSASKARDALQKTYDMMVHEGLIPEDIRQATKTKLERAKLILSQQHYANRELGNLVLQNLKPSVLAQLGGGLEAAKALANQIIRAVNEAGDTDKVFDSAPLKSQFEKLFGERGEQTRQAFWLAYKGREARAADQLFKQAGEGVGGENGRTEHVVGEDGDGNTTLSAAEAAVGKEGSVVTSDDAVWNRGDDTAEYNSTDGNDGDAHDSDLANMTNAMAPTTIKPPEAKFHHHTMEKKPKYDQMEGGSGRRRFHDVYDPGQGTRVSSILESDGFDEARLNSLREQDDLNNMAVPYIKGHERTFEKSGATVRHDEQLAKAIADIKSRGVSEAKAVGYIDYLKEKFGVPDSYDAENPPDSARRFDAAVAKIVKRFSQDSDSPETKIEIANVKKMFANTDWVEKQRAKKLEGELAAAEHRARRELTDVEKEEVTARVNRQFKDYLAGEEAKAVEARRRKNEPNYDKLLTAGLNPYTKEALDEINRKLFVIKEEAKNDAFSNTGMRIDSSEFNSVSHGSSSNYWGVAPGANGEFTHAAAGGIWLRRASDGKAFLTTADKIVQRARKAMFAAGETQNVKGAKATHDLFLQGLAMLFEPEDATGDTKALNVVKGKDARGNDTYGVSRTGDSTNIDAVGEGYTTKAGVLPEIGIFEKQLGKHQLGDVPLTSIEKLSIPDNLKIGGTTWGELRKNARERSVDDDRIFLRAQQKELGKRIAELDKKIASGEGLTETEDFEYGNLLKNHDVAKDALRFEELNATVKKLEATRQTRKLTKAEEKLYAETTTEIGELYHADKVREENLELKGIEKRIADQQKIVSDMRNGLVKVDKESWGEDVGAEEAARLHADYEAHMAAGGNRKVGLPQLGIDVMRDHPEAVKLRKLQALYDTKYEGIPGKTASLADAVTHLSRWQDDLQKVYDHDDYAKRTLDALSDAEYKSIRPLKGETKEAAIARHARRKFNNQKSMLNLIENFHVDTKEHEGGKSVTHTFNTEGMVKGLGGGWRALNEWRTSKGKQPVDKVTYLQSEMDLVRSLINEPETSQLWDKYNPNYALPKINSGKKDKWGAAREQVVSAMTGLRNAREVSNMAQEGLREAKANYEQVLADAKAPGSVTSEVHVKAFAKNLQDARQRFLKSLDVLRDKQQVVDEVEFTNQHLVDEYKTLVKDRADEIHRLKEGLRALVAHVDGLVGTPDRQRQVIKYTKYNASGEPVLRKDGTSVYIVGDRGFSDRVTYTEHNFTDSNGNDVGSRAALKAGYTFLNDKFVRLEDDNGNVVSLDDAANHLRITKNKVRTIPVSEKEALKDGFSYTTKNVTALDDAGKPLVTYSRRSDVGRSIDIAAKAEDTEIYKRIAKENNRERSYQEETGAALGAYESPEYIKSSLDRKDLEIARNLARTSPEFDPNNAKGGWTQAMVDAWNGEKAKMAKEDAQNRIYPTAVARLEEKGVPAVVRSLRDRSPEEQAHWIDTFEKMANGGKDVWGDKLPSDKTRGLLMAAAKALRGVEEKRWPLEKQTVLWGKGAEAGKILGVLGKDGVYRNSMGHEVLVSEHNTTSADNSPVNVWAGSGENTVLSNLAPRKFAFKGREYVSVEQAYQSWKSGVFEKDIYDKYTGRTAQKIPGTLGTKTEGGFNLHLIKALMKASFEQNESAKQALLATGERPITHTQDKGIWNKEFPRILTEIRSELSDKTTPKSKATLSMNYADGTDGMRMRPEFAGKSTMDLIASGDRTATTRSSIGGFKGVKEGDVFTVTNAAGNKIQVRATSNPYPVSKVTPEQWSKLEGWSPSVYNKYRDGFQMTYEKVNNESTPAATESVAATKNISEAPTTVATLVGHDAGVRETMHAVKELIQNPLSADDAVAKFSEARAYIKGKLKEVTEALTSSAGDQTLLNKQERFSRAYAAVEAAEVRFSENQYIRAEGYPDMASGKRGVMTKRLKAEERTLVDSGENAARLEQVRKLLDMAQKKSKRIAPAEELTSVAASPKRLDLMLGEANAAHVFAPPSEDVVQAMRESVVRRFGDRIRAIFEQGDTVTHADLKAGVENWGADGAAQKVSGLWSSAENLIKVALATQNPTKTLDHESFHAFYSGMVEGGVLTEGARQILVKAANSEYVRKRLDALFPENNAQHADIGFGKEKNALGVTNAESERMANMFAMWRAGELTLAPAPRNIFAKIWGKLRSVLGILREEDKADVILKAFDAGDLKTNEAVHALYENLTARDKLITEVNRLTRPIAVVAQRLLFTAEANLDKAGVMFSPEYKKIRRLFKRAVGEGGENGYLDAKDQMMKKFSNLVAAPFRNLEPEDVPRLANALAGGYEHPTTAIGKAKEALVGENGLIRQIDQYMADAGVQYLAGIDEKTGNQIWKKVAPMPAGSMPKSLRVNDVMSRGDEFVADLWQHNHKEMTEMFNSTRAKFDLAVDQVKTPDQELAEFNRAVIQRVINTFGQLHIPELSTDISMSPIMQALNSRAISWVHPEVYKKWGENDVMKTFTSYASQAVKLAESVRRFGNGNVGLHAMLQKAQWDGLRKEIQHSFSVDIGEKPPKYEDDLLKPTVFHLAHQALVEAKPLSDVEKVHLDSIFKRIGDVAKKAGTDVAGMQGLLGYDINPTLRKVQNSMLVYQNLRSLSTSLLSQFIDPLNLVVRGATMGEAWEAYKRGLREVVASIKGEEIRDLDLTIAEHVGTVDAHGFLGAYGQLYSSEYMGNWFRKANDFLFRYNGMEGFNRGMQVAATRSAINFIKRHVEKPGKNSSSYLAELGLRAEKVKIDARGELDYDDPRIQRAIYQWVSGAVMRPNASQRPAYASDPHYMVFWHMKQFAYTFHDSIMKRAIHDYKKYGDTGPLGVMATCFAPVMIAADVAKSVLLTGDAPGWWKSGLPDIIEHGVNRAGLSGRYQPIVDIAVTPGRSWLGLGGPMVEQLQQLGDQTMGQAAVSALPGQNVIKQVFGIGGVEALNTPED